MDEEHGGGGSPTGARHPAPGASVTVCVRSGPSSEPLSACNATPDVGSAQSQDRIKAINDLRQRPRPTSRRRPATACAERGLDVRRSPTTGGTGW
jgi:hypothetical protein